MKKRKSFIAATLGLCLMATAFPALAAGTQPASQKPQRMEIALRDGDGRLLITHDPRRTIDTDASLNPSQLPRKGTVFMMFGENGYVTLRYSESTPLELDLHPGETPQQVPSGDAGVTIGSPGSVRFGDWVYRYERSPLQKGSNGAGALISFKFVAAACKEQIGRLAERAGYSVSMPHDLPDETVNAEIQATSSMEALQTLCKTCGYACTVDYGARTFLIVQQLAQQ